MGGMGIDNAEKETPCQFFAKITPNTYDIKPYGAQLEAAKARK